MTGEDRELGLGRRITRRDFLNGVAVATGGAASLGVGSVTAGAVARSQSGAPSPYPPARTGLRGSHEGSFEAAHARRDGQSWAADAVDTGETYDLVVVGGGISGLSAAHFFRARVGPQARILVLDNHDDFGGHAKRNEFRYDGRLLMLNGGTLNIEAPKQYSGVAMGLLNAIGIDIDRFESTTAPDRNLYRDRRLGSALFFDRETFGSDRTVTGYRSRPLKDVLADSPMHPDAQRDAIRLEDPAQPDYMPGLSSDDKKARLLRTSYLDYLLGIAKVHPQAAWLHQARSKGLFLMESDGLPAYYAWAQDYPGFAGLKLDPIARDVLAGEPGGAHGRENQARADEGGRSVHFPDGNATVARLLVRSLVPDAVPGATQEDVVTAVVDYGRLDRAESPVRIRLSSIAAHVTHQGSPASARGVQVTYVQSGKAYRVRGDRCVLACWNTMIPHLCPELPDAQKQALAYGLKGPIVYTNVLLRNWQAFARLGISNVTAPGGYHHGIRLSEPVSLGAFAHPREPNEPMVIHLNRTPCRPGLPRNEQFRIGRTELLTTTFETFEREIRSQLARTLGGGGFDPARDVIAITVNRWPHGYTMNYNTLFDPVEWALGTSNDRPCVVGRQRFGRITIANADSAASSHTDAAIDMAHRAVGELFEPSGSARR